MKYRLHYINEPLLEFGYNQKTIDPRDGITLFGPYDKSKLMIGNFGVIGTSIGIRRMKDWLMKVQKPIYSAEQDAARPFFPGLEAAFGFSVNMEGLKEIIVQDREIQNFLMYKDSYQRVHNLVNLYSQKLIKYKHEEEMPITVWFVIISDEIYLHSRPKSRAPAGANIDIGIKDKYGRINPSLFEEYNQLQEAYKYEINFHNQLKAKLLKESIVTQIIKESTIAYRETFKSEFQINNETKFDSAKAWNIATTLYYKSGGLPWKLGSVRPRVCYLGLVYKKMDENSNKKTACCAAQMFLDSGDGLVFKGNVGPWYNPDSGEYHLSRESAKDLLQKALSTFHERNGTYPEEIFIHAKTYFDDNEWQGFEEAANGKSKIVGIRITSNSHLKLYREEKFSIPRGMSLVINEQEAYLWTKGFVPRIQTQMGLEVPNPLNIIIAKGTSDINTVCRDVLSLTKLNYNACIYGDGVPVTLRFADMIGEILTAGPLDDLKVLPFKHYI